MGKPTVSVTAEPREGGEIVYGPLAAKTKNDDTNGQLSVLFNIKNNEGTAITFNQVTVEFIGSPNVSPVPIPVSPGVQIANGATAQWYFPTANNIILPDPAPGTVRFSLSFDTYTDPEVVELPLTPYASNGYPFPARTSDLKKGEFWGGQSAVHGGAGGGTQMFAYDLSVVGYDTGASQWRTVIEGTAGTANDHYHVWGKPIHALAAGTVVQFLDGMAENTPPGFPNPTPPTVEGNHFYIQHGADLALYAHLQPGTLPADLMVNGAAVAEGQVLGLAGNTGRSSEPHLHIQINRATVPWGGVGRPLTFRDAYVLDIGEVDTNAWPPNTNDAWNPIEGRAMPDTWSAIWPGKIKIGWSWKTLFYVLAWAWLIVIGGLMITPGGISCIKCGRLFESILATVSIGMGVIGLATQFASKAPRTGNPAPGLGTHMDMHS